MSKLFAFNVSDRADSLHTEGHYDAHLQVWQGDSIANAGLGTECADTYNTCDQIQRAYRDLYGCTTTPCVASCVCGSGPFCFAYSCPD